MSEKLLLELFDRVAALEEKMVAIERNLSTIEDDKEESTGMVELKGKYRLFSDYLQKCESDVLILSFNDIEEILHQELPPSAREHRAMWANTETNSLAASWLNIGYRTTKVDLENEKIKFEKTRYYMKGYDNHFKIKNGVAPHSESSSITGVYRGEEHPLVYNKDNRCVGVVFEHYEARGSTANEQAEICFFDGFYNDYGKWHRMFNIGYKKKEKIMYAAFKRDLDEQGEINYVASIRKRR